MKRDLSALALAAGVLAGCAGPTPARAGPSRAVTPPALVDQRPGPITTATPLEPSEVYLAMTYVAESLSYDYRRGPGAWIASVGGLCTPQWRAALVSSADGGAGGWSQILATRSVARASVTNVLAAKSPPGAVRLEVTATVEVAGTRTSHYPAAMLVDLIPNGAGGWLVAWAQ